MLLKFFHYYNILFTSLHKATKSKEKKCRKETFEPAHLCGI